MAAKVEERSLRVFCPTHKISFPVISAGTILCESRKHSLGQDFPYNEFWEYCCDCQTFLPSEIAKSGKGRDQCPACDRQIVRQFLCDRCKVLSFESDESTKRKSFYISAQGAVEPSCPGCLNSVEYAPQPHLCAEVNATFMTSRASCPFCEEAVNREIKRSGEERTVRCIHCGAANNVATKFCTGCGKFLKRDKETRIKVAKRSTATLPPHTSSLPQERIVAAPPYAPPPPLSPQQTLVPPITDNGTRLRVGPSPQHEGQLKPIASAAPSEGRVKLLIGGLLLAVIVMVVFGVIKSQLHTQIPTSLPTSVPRAAPQGMTYVPGGEFLMGSNSGDDYERPQHKVIVKPFYIDLYEVTCEQYQKFVDATGHMPPQGWQNGRFPAGDARWPVTGVNWDDANAYAKWAGKRLPTEEEWEFAARGTDGRRYPWGGEWKPGAANADATSPGHAMDIGTHPDGRSPFGVFDMVGNAWEWTSSDLTAYPNSRIPSTTEPMKVIRGGYWGSRLGKATTTFRRGWSPRSEVDYKNTGFRCASNAPS